MLWDEEHPKSPGLFPVPSASGIEHNCSCGLECRSGACCCYYKDSELSCSSIETAVKEESDLLTLADASEQPGNTKGAPTPPLEGKRSRTIPVETMIEGGNNAASADLKRCRRCNKLLPRHTFCENARSADGLYTQCRVCVSEKDKQRRQTLKEEKRRPVATKVCSRCQQTKPMQDFYLDQGRSDGLQTYCRVCYSQSYREKRAGDRAAVTT